MVLSGGGQTYSFLTERTCDISGGESIFSFLPKVEQTSKQHVPRSQMLTNRKKMLKNYQLLKFHFLLVGIIFKIITDTEPISI